MLERTPQCACSYQLTLLARLEQACDLVVKIRHTVAFNTDLIRYSLDLTRHKPFTPLRHTTLDNVKTLVSPHQVSASA